VQWQGKGRNLHAVWDVLVLERALAAGALDEAGYLRRLQARPPLPADPSRHSDRPAADWAQESCRVIEGDAIRPRTHVLDAAYLDAHRARVDRQLRLAGARLAGMLNSALDPASAGARQ
jgi:hypothetical protein